MERYKTLGGWVCCVCRSTFEIRHACYVRRPNQPGEWRNLHCYRCAKQPHACGTMEQ